MSGARVLYISYDGMLEPLGQSQVLSYLKHLARTNQIHLISFEKREDWLEAEHLGQLRQEIAAAGVDWHPLRYHKRPSALATGWDIIVGIFVAFWLCLRHRVSIVHARSYVSAVIALALKKTTGVRFIFDMRGFWADERVDGGIWPRGGTMYRLAKWFEKQFLRNADHVISLTHAAAREMLGFEFLREHPPELTVIPTCADLSTFSMQTPDDPRPAFILGYVGSAGTWYLFDEVIACFQELLRIRPQARFLVVNRGQHAFIRERLLAAGVPETAFELITSKHADVPRHMGRMDAGIFFYKPTFSRLATAPTKLGEFLGCGIPCLGNVGVGDMAEILEGDRVGVALQAFDPHSVRDGLQRFLALCDDPLARHRCVAAAEKYFSLNRGVRLYESVYARLETTA